MIERARVVSTICGTWLPNRSTCVEQFADPIISFAAASIPVTRVSMVGGWIWYSRDLGSAQLPNYPSIINKPVATRPYTSDKFMTEATSMGRSTTGPDPVEADAQNCGDKARWLAKLSLTMLQTSECSCSANQPTQTPTIDNFWLLHVPTKEDARCQGARQVNQGKVYWTTFAPRWNWIGARAG